MQVILESPRAIRLSALPPLAVYVHIPWCVRKCPYCDFNSHERSAALPEAAYVERLMRDLEGILPSVWGRRATSVFIGGGTPSLFSPDSIDALLSGLRARLPLEPGAEVTLEANPGTVEAARFRGYREAGVNRISVGVQSFDDAMLAAIGRIHGGQEAARAVEAAMESVGNVNVDLMYGLPGQSVEMALQDVRRAVALGVPHLSAYQLTIEPNTVFWRRPPALPAHDASADMQRAIEEALAGASYRQYETSAFAKDARQSRHNLNYWMFGDYLGLGAGAHGKVSYADRITRHARARQPGEYLQRSDTLVEQRDLSPAEIPFEFMLNALRLVDGFEAALFSERTGLPLSKVERALGEAEAKGLVERDWKRIRPTDRGRRFLNDLLSLFLDGGSTGPG